MFAAALELLLPENCELCALPSSTGPVCGGCEAELVRHGHGACPRCGDLGASGETCGHCLREPPSFDATRAAFVYGFPLDHLVQRLKYGHRLHLARWFAAELAPKLADLRADLIVPMPLSPNRLRERGFNQAAEIARPLARIIGARFVIDACRRVRDTAPQAGLARDARLRNLSRAFECRLNLDGKHVLLLDDVMTTGTSADELARVLKLHGAARVTVGVGARTMSA